MNFRTKFQAKKSDIDISHNSKILMFGSCFAENIGQKLFELKFPIHINPFGIIYNPVSVFQSLEYIIERKEFRVEDLEFYNEKWISFNHHGRFSSANYDDTLKLINDEIEKASFTLKDAQFLFITLGTSWIYRRKRNSKIVSNCHKLPGIEFEHFSLSIPEIEDLYKPMLAKLHQYNKNLKIVFTVSPVRHWKDGPMQNQYSKSVLIVAVQELVQEFDFVSYFPSYEIMMDDLRDYRFYSDDLFHPNQVAIEYIWEKFKDCFLSVEAIEISIKIDKILKSMRHRVFYPKTLSYKKFITNCMNMIDEIQNNHPDISLLEEYSFFEKEFQIYFKE